MARNPELIIKIGANSKEFDRVLSELGPKATKAQSAMNLAAKAGSAATLAIASGLAVSIKAAAEFEKSFSNVITLLDKSSFSTKDFSDGVDSLRQGVLKLRAETGDSFENLNKGLFDLISAGVSAEGAITALRAATNLSISGATNTAVAVDGITSALNAYSFEASKSQEIADKFFLAQKFGKTTVEELSSGFGLVASSASNFGISLDELLAAVSAATTGGIRTSQAYTGLAAIIQNIVVPTERAATEAERLGIEFNSTALRAQGFDKFLKSITESAEFNNTSLEKLFGSTEAMKTVFALTGSAADDFDKILSSLGDTQLAAATNAAALAEKNNTLDQSTKRLQGSIATLAVSVGNEFAPQVSKVFNALGEGIDENTPKFIRFLRDLTAGMATVAETIGDFFKSVFLGAFGEIQRFAANSLIVLSDVVRGIESLSEKVGLNLDFSNQIQSLEKQALSFGLAANENLAGNDDEGFLKRLNERLDALRTYNDEQDSLERQRLENQKENEAAAAESTINNEIIKNEILGEIKEEEKQKDQEDRDDRLDLEDDRFEEDLERLNNRLTGIDEVESEFSGLRELRELQELKTKAKTAAQKQQIDQQTALASKKASDAATMTALDNLQTVFSEETAVGKAIFLIRKAQAIANTIASTQQAMALARATVPPPAGEALAQRYAIAGAINVGVIAATAITGAADGGIVQGGSFGRDTQPFMLAKDEIIVPSRLNPLSPNFEETFGGGFGGGGSVKVEIGLEDNASKILTVRQREDRALGVQR
jgi:TP901 family phage tail tape measure protein